MSMGCLIRPAMVNMAESYCDYMLRWLEMAMMFVCEVGGGVVMPRSIEIGRGFDGCTAAQGYSQM